MPTWSGIIDPRETGPRTTHPIFAFELHHEEDGVYCAWAAGMEEQNSVAFFHTFLVRVGAEGNVGSLARGGQVVHV